MLDVIAWRPYKGSMNTTHGTHTHTHEAINHALAGALLATGGLLLMALCALALL